MRLRLVIIFSLLLLFAFGAFADSGTIFGAVCNGSISGWDFFSGYPLTANVNCDSPNPVNIETEAEHSPYCCNGTITQVDHYWSCTYGGEAYNCSGACTPTGRIVVNCGSCSENYYNSCDNDDGCGRTRDPTTSGYNSCSLASDTSCGVETQCDGIDNDCDGLVDEDDVCVCYKEEDPNGNIYPFNNIIPPDGVISYWQLNDNTTTILDYFENNDGTRTGATYTSQGRFLGAYSFDGTNDFINVNDSSTLDFANDKSIVLSAWVKTTNTSSNPQGIVSRYGLSHSYSGACGSAVPVDDGANNLWLMLYKTGGANGKAAFIARSSDSPTNAGEQSLVSTTNINDGEWHHVAGVIDRVENKVKLFVDGNPEDSVRIITSTTVGATQREIDWYTNNSPAGAYISNRPAFIGSQCGAFIEESSYFNGQIDDVVLSSKLLSECEIKKLAKGPSACLDDCSNDPPIDDTFVCIGSLPENSELFSLDENRELSFPLNIALVDSNTTRKCEAKCVSNYHIENGACVLDVGASCVGDIPNNSLLCENDADLEGFFDNVIRSLVGEDILDCTDTKCEYYCLENYVQNGDECVLESGLKECFDNPAPMENPNEIIPGSMIIGTNTYPNTESDKFWSYASDATLIDPCVWKCTDDYIRQENTCVIEYSEQTCSGAPPTTGDGKIIGSDKYYISTYNPKEWTYNLSATGDMNCEWKCDSGYTRAGNNCVQFGVSDVNNIEFLNLSLEDGNVIAEVQCSNKLSNMSFEMFDGQNTEVTGEMVFFSYEGEEVLNGTLDCNLVPVKYILQYSGYEGTQKYLVNASIQQPCNICLRSAYVLYQGENTSTIPDANMLIAILVLVSAVFIVSRKRI